MALYLERLTPLLLAFLGYCQSGKKHPKLNLSALSERDIADLNLPQELKGRLLGQRDVQKIRRRF